MKRSARTMLIQQKANNTDTIVTRTDVVRLLQEVGDTRKLDLSGQNLRGINLMNFNLRGANLSEAQVSEANLCGANLSQADLHGADMSRTYLCWANLHSADLGMANLCEADLSWADLPGADLHGVNLDGATLNGTSLCRADLRGTSLDKTDLRGANLSWASLSEARTYEHTRNQLRFRGAIFSDTPHVKVVERFSDEVGRYALRFSLGLLSMTVVSLLGVIGMRVLLIYMRLKRHSGDSPT
jgi:uncharacterized protein YjbI with pentapeptide repeats